MDDVLKFLDGKKTYISTLVLAGLGIMGLSDEVALGSAESYAHLGGIAVATAGAVYSRFLASKPKKVKKTRKPRAKKVQNDQVPF